MEPNVVEGQKGAAAHQRGVRLGCRARRHPILQISPPSKTFTLAREAAGAPGTFLVVSAKNVPGVPGGSPAFVGVLDGGGDFFSWFFGGTPVLGHFSAVSVT